MDENLCWRWKLEETSGSVEENRIVPEESVRKPARGKGGAKGKSNKGEEKPKRQPSGSRKGTKSSALAAKKNPSGIPDELPQRYFYKSTWNTHDIQHSPVEKTINMIDKILSGERLFTM